jgi:hypothetical protein
MHYEIIWLLNPLVWERRLPMIRNLLPRCDPHPLMLTYILQEPPQARQSRWPPDRPSMQTNRHHLGLACLAFAVQLVERALKVGEEGVRWAPRVVRAVFIVVSVESDGRQNLRLL